MPLYFCDSPLWCRDFLVIMELAYLFNIKSDAKVIIHDLYISHNHSNRRLIDEIDMGVNDPALIPLKHTYT